MKHFYLLILCSIISFSAIAQASVKGKVTDAETGEALILVNVSVGTKGVTTDFDGLYQLDLPAGLHEVKFSYIGYDDVIKNVTIGSENVTLDVKMGGALDLEEITITADIAVARKTPVAFTNVSTAKLNEELASQDIPMILNSTPGAYATQQGGGDGDARVTIRGFDQRNVAVMLDGIPVNDMENGAVYWSNWFGLDLVTKTVQVQRGLGASKLAIPSVGGTINILTKGIESRKEVRFRQEVGNNGFLRSTLGATSGRLENGWGVSVAASYKQGNGWVDALNTQGYFYYLRVDKELGNHLISFSGFGAPQEHGQRSFGSPIATFDTTYAKELGVQSSEFPVNGVDYGLRYNQHAGTLDGELVNTRNNFYHKPQFSLRHSWTPTQRLFISNVAYLSVGNGGGTRVEGSLFGSDDLFVNGGQFDLDSIYRANQSSNIFKPDGLSENYLFANKNNHFWYGLLSTVEFQMNDNWTFSGGIDLRSYTGEHLREVHDLLGGEFIENTGDVINYRLPEDEQLVVGDNILYNYKSYIQWGGLFGLAEYEKDGLSAFLNLSAAQSVYAYEDFLGPKVLTTDNFITRITAGDTIVDGDKTYTIDSPEAENFKIDNIVRPSFTIKTGAAYRLDEQHNVFFNVGYLSRPTRFTNVINSYQNDVDTDAESPSSIRNELVTSFEFGYGFKSKYFASNVNAYYTNWTNRPLDFPISVPVDPADPDSDRIPVNIQGLAARHAGIEIDFALLLSDKLAIEGIVSLGDWIWNSSDTVLLPNGTTYEFDATGVHVGNAAQFQLGGLIRYEPIEDLYFKLKTTYFGKNYANFNPEDLKGATAGKESWKMPDYNLVDFHAGYRLKIKNKKSGKNHKIDLRLNILNLLNTTYVSDARNNDRFTQAFNTFDARSAAVFLGQGTRWTTSIQFTF